MINTCIQIQVSDNVIWLLYRDNETKSGKFIFDDDNEYSPYRSQKARQVLNPSPPDSNERQVPRTTVTTFESDCPVENGVVRTKWGSVSLGSVLTGLAAGLYPQQIQLQELVRKTMNSRTLSPELRSAVIDNKYAATLVGMDYCNLYIENRVLRRIFGPKRDGVTGGW
jgi:hypothetical protein